MWEGGGRFFLSTKLQILKLVSQNHFSPIISWQGRKVGHHICLPDDASPTRPVCGNLSKKFSCACGDRIHAPRGQRLGAHKPQPGRASSNCQCTTQARPEGRACVKMHNASTHRRDRCRPPAGCGRCRTGWARDEFYCRSNFCRSRLCSSSLWRELWEKHTDMGSSMKKNSWRHLNPMRLCPIKERWPVKQDNLCARRGSVPASGAKTFTTSTRSK